MAGGWSKDGAVQDQINVRLEEAVELVQSPLHQGESVSWYALLHSCQTEIYQQQLLVSGYN
ncbi:MAG: hypothetical protein ACI935_003986 [Moritella dasanensis]|jgi:hypothetical protein